MLKWQISGVFGQADEDEQQFTAGQEALTIMRNLLEGGGLRPSVIQVHHVMGYLSGDLAQAYEEAGEKETRNELLDEAIESWKFLSATNPREPEYMAGLAWCENLLNK